MKDDKSPIPSTATSYVMDERLSSMAQAIHDWLLGHDDEVDATRERRHESIVNTVTMLAHDPNNQDLVAECLILLLGLGYANQRQGAPTLFKAITNRMDARNTRDTRVEKELRERQVSGVNFAATRRSAQPMLELKGGSR